VKHQIQFVAGLNYQLFATDEVMTPITGHHIITEFGELTPDGKLVTQSGFGWNGPDVVHDWKSFMRSSMYHDWFYLAMAKKLLPLDCKQAVDDFMRQVCVEDGMWGWYARMMYRGVRLNPEPDDREVLTAP